MFANSFAVLLAEDDSGHATLVEKNLRRAGVTNRFFRVQDGQEALDFLQKQGKYVQRAEDMPLLMLLDIRMPKVDGMEVMRRLQSVRKPTRIPIVVLTTTDDPREIVRCYELGCSAYITKPVEYEQFVEAIRRLGLFLQTIRVA